jgi:hypothetical protein
MDYTLGDIAAAARSVDNDDGFREGGGLVWIIILFLFVFMGGGLGGIGGLNRQGGCATTEDVQSQFNFAALERQNNETVAAVRNAQYDTMSGTKDLAYNNLGAIRDVGSAVDALQPAIENCCCNILRANDQTRFDMANYACQIQKNATENSQKILDAITANRMSDLQNRVNQLELQSALCGVVRYPTAMAYSAGTSPFCGGSSTCGCGC